MAERCDERDRVEEFLAISFRKLIMQNLKTERLQNVFAAESRTAPSRAPKGFLNIGFS